MFKADMIQDFIYQGKSELVATTICLNELQNYFLSKNKCNKDFDLPEPVFLIDEDCEDDFDVELEKEMAKEYYEKLNHEQKNAVDRILTSIERNAKTANCFFLDGPGGTGKTFIYNTVTHILRSKGKKVVSVASTGIASTLLINGRTVHHVFDISLEIDEFSSSYMKLNSKKAKKLFIKLFDLIIWDEAPMTS
jgi:hypothetical protein